MKKFKNYLTSVVTLVVKAIF